jgi:hypothetical protein
MLDRRYKGILQGALLLVIIGWAVWKFGFSMPGSGDGDCKLTSRVPVDELVYVAHAKCRMACRDIDRQLVEKVYLHGEINCKKSSVKEGKHRYAIEKRDDRGDMIRIIVEDDDGHHVIVTVIRLDKEDHCACS